MQTSYVVRVNIFDFEAFGIIEYSTTVDTVEEVKDIVKQIIDNYDENCTAVTRSAQDFVAKKFYVKGYIAGLPEVASMTFIPIPLADLELIK